MCVRTYVSLHVTDDAALVYELTHVVLSGETTVNLAKHQPTPPGQTAAIAGQTDSCCAAFIGCRLDKDHLKDWLRQCTVQVNLYGQCHSDNRNDHYSYYNSPI